MNYLIALVTLARVALYLANIAVIIWLACQVSADLRGGSTPTSTHRLHANDRLAPGDLATTAIDALIAKYLLADLDSNKPVLPGMVSDHPGVPVIPSGIDIVVNVDKQLVHGLNVRAGHPIRVEKDGQTLIESATVIAVACDQARCAVILNTGKLPSFDPAKLLGIDLVPVMPMSPTAPQ
jgi:hypothetical protein